jgi:NodT family efflux transporter outer membrane factor (OMF) lipoprotein
MTLKSKTSASKNGPFHQEGCFKPHSLKTPFAKTALMGMALSLGSCSFVPPLKDTGFSVPLEFRARGQESTELKITVSVSASAAAQDPLLEQKVMKAQSPWWTELEDPLLNELEERILKSNVSLFQLATQVRVAQASLKQAEASLFPTLNLNMSASRAANQLSVPKGTSYSLSAPMSWELDIWGRIDALTQVASSNALASEWDLKQAQVSVQALLVQTYASLKAARGQEALLRLTVDVYQKSLELTQAKYKSGVVSSSDVAQANTQLKSTQAQLQDLVIQRKQIEHALATLLGMVPAQLNTLLESSEALPKAPALPELLVLDVLQYRADIQAAKRRVEAANAQLGVARAAFFPPLVLSASAGYRNTDLASLVSAPNQAWSIGPSLVLPLIDGGFRQAAKESAQAQLDNAVLSYKQVVLNAFQEIEDNLVAQEQLQLMESSWRDAVKSAARNLEVTQAQYKAGVVPYLNVVSAQSAHLSAERSLLDVQSRQLLAWNQLKKNTFVQGTTEDQRK